MICLVGGKGSIGSRYAAIMKWANIPFCIYDTDTPHIDLLSYSKYLIASPTDTHVHFLNLLRGRTILCEKPISKVASEIPPDPYMFVVNNYQYVARLMNESAPYFISYDYYRTGKDGMLWDCCQLVHMDNECELGNTSPIWNCTINGKIVTYRIVEESYIRMIKDFYNGNYDNLWDMSEALEMTLAVENRIKDESKR